MATIAPGTTSNGKKVYQVGADGKAPSGLSQGDYVVTNAGTYKIDGVKADGGYESTLINKDVNTQTYKSGYATPAVSAPSGGTSTAAAAKTQQTAKVGSGGNAGGNYTGSMNATDPYGNKITVRYDNGKLVSDVPEGTVMHTNGGDFTYYKDKTDTDDMISTLIGIVSGDNSSYAQALKSQQAANNASVQKAVNALEAQKTDTNQSYSDLFRQLYINKMNSQKNMDQKLAAQGITGGMAESNRLGVETSYSEALRQGEQERINALNDLDKAITDTRLTGDIENASAAAESAKQSAAAYSEVLQSLISRNDSLDQQKTSEDSTEKNYMRSLVLSMAQSGEMPSDVLIGMADLNKSDIEAIVAANKKSTYTAEQAAAAVMAARNGDTSDTVRKIIESYYGMSMESVLAANNESTYTADQAALAVMAAKNGDTSDAVRKAIESYYGFPMETVLKAYSD